MRLRGIALGTVALAACTSGPDQVAVPPPSPDLTVDATAPTVTTAPTTVATLAATTLATTPSPTTTPPTTAPPTTVPSAPERPTIDELLDSGRVLNIAHAGGDQAWPHSTFFAYDNAYAAGADMLEMDVLLTADGELIVQHDETVDRTTNGTGAVDALTFDEVVALDAGYWFAEDCWPCHDLPDDRYIHRGVRTGDREPPPDAEPDDFRIVGFAEMVERYPDMPFDIEIKGSGDTAAAVAAALAREIERLDLTDHVVVGSFDDAAIELFHELMPDVHVSPGAGALAAWLLDGEPLDDAYRIIQVPPLFGETAVITPEFWDAVDATGVAVWVWPNDADQENTEFYQEMIDQGASGIIAGRPSEVP